MKIAIDMMPRKLPGGDRSHTGAWAYLRANQLKHIGIDAQVLGEKGRGISTDWSEFDQIYVYHTLDFQPEEEGYLNIFDGPTENTAKYFERLAWPQHDKLKYVSLDYPMPDYGFRCQNRIDTAGETAKIAPYWLNANWTKVQEVCDTITDWMLDPGVKFTLPYQGRVKADWIKQTEGLVHIHKKLTMGDSHIASVYTPKSLVLRKDGRTLAGVLKKTIKQEATDFGYDWNQIDELTCYYGNIDIRHHICREADPISYTKQLVQEYANELKKHSEKKIEVVCPLPIEDESRKLPSTGLFKKTPFFGSRQERQEVVKVFKEELHKHAKENGWSVFEWPAHWYEMNGIEFFEHMEVPRSVHLARRYYRWDLENDCLNPKLVKTSSKLLEF